MTKLSNEERKAMIEGFYEKVSEGSSMDAGWKKAMVDASSPTLPDEPSPEQIDAWVELSEIVHDPSFVEHMKHAVQETWKPGFDHVAYKRAAERMLAESKGLTPESAEAKGVVERCLAGFAAAMGQASDEAFRRALRKRYEEQDPRATRYWQLVAVLKGRPPPADPGAEWAWFTAASRHHFPLRRAPGKGHRAEALSAKRRFRYARAAGSMKGKGGRSPLQCCEHPEM